MAIKLRLGALLGPVVDGAASNMLAEQARRYAGEGFTSLWAAQAIGRGFMVPDPFLVMTVAATATEGVEIGSAIVQVPLYHPLDFAHRVLSLQQICGDRLILGVGAGSTRSDYAAFDRDPETRFQALPASLEALRSVYRPGSPLNGVLTPWPSLAAPRIFYGTWGKGVEKAAREFDGWIASGHYRSVEEVSQAAERYRSAGGGRSIVSTLILDAETDLGEFRSRLARYAAAGFDDAVVMIRPGGPSPAQVRQLLD